MMCVDMWVDLLKQLLLDEKYHHPAMEDLVGLFRFRVGFMKHTQYARVYSMMVVRV